jgi:hypothetical protein
MIARNPEIVEAYLDKHAYIIEFLETIRPTLTKFFGRSVNVELEVLTYPDESGTEELVGWIQYTGGDIERGLDLLEELEGEIFDKQIEMVGNSFNFNIEFSCNLLHLSKYLTIFLGMITY